ncbi:hypothetical protein L7F22_044484 [Adiantum nelumboides]|nr:hypothetical protein [Adiantum nelumboides]
MKAESSRAGCLGAVTVEEVEDALLRCIWLDFQGLGTGTVLGWASSCPRWCSSSVYLQSRLRFWQGRREAALFSWSEAPRGKLRPTLIGCYDGAWPTFGLLGVYEWEAMASPTVAVASTARCSKLKVLAFGSCGQELLQKDDGCPVWWMMEALLVGIPDSGLAGEISNWIFVSG